MTDDNPVNDRIRKEFAVAHGRFSFETFPNVVQVAKDLWEPNSGIDFYNLAARVNATTFGKWSVNVSFPSDYAWEAGLWEFSFEQKDDATAFRATLPATH